MTLRQRVEHSSYEVDPQAVAGAIVERLLLRPRASAVGSAPARGAAGRSGDVLEAG